MDTGVISDMAIMLTPRSASANWIGGFNCFGEPRCVRGCHAIIQAQTRAMAKAPAPILNPLAQPGLWLFPTP